MIRFEHVTKQFPDGTEALKNTSLVFPTHKLTVVIGPSGCGKTTLMRMVNKLEKPTSGDIFIDEKPITDLEEVQLRRSIGYVIQRIGLFPHMTIAENVSLVPRLLEWPKEKTDRRVEELLELVGLEPEIYKERYPLELSGGQQQRVGVVRALAGDPNIILMDEPFSALDPISREQLQDDLRNLQQEIRKTIVFVTHDMDEALKIADTIVVMRDGEVEQVGTPQELISNPANDFVKSFIGLDRINRQRSFGERKLKEFLAVFGEVPREGALQISGEATIDDAFSEMEKSGHPYLQIVEAGRTLAYVSDRDLVKAALQKQEGEKV
ncbi:ABC transporter ATP-binding protein [Planococcus salinarum]|uniref:ABC transporter ATP-binding protein n=1 Tax=Planococcus salinarum TaxID=622695 RepID=UPI000E3C3A7B|nr:ABC transporter ATP-binding protein [Planococcus salinarum]TAA71887.1 ABC transporter ATP-binding protein [Planococcus salinarum]